MNKLDVIINGLAYSGWKNVVIQQSMTQLAGVFTVSTTEELMEDSKSWHIRNGDVCTINIEEQTILTGYVDSIVHSYNNKEHQIILKGRDKTCDLIDCSYYSNTTVNAAELEYRDREWKNKDAKTIITDICTPFGIIVMVDKDSEGAQEAASEPLVVFQINDGETALNSITRICQSKGLIAMTDGDGILRLTRTRNIKCSDSLTTGENILSGQLIQSDRERFSRYIIKGKGKTDGKYLLISTINPSAIVEDEVVRKKIGMQEDRSTPSYRYRPKVILTDVVANYDINPALQKIVESVYNPYTHKREPLVPPEVRNYVAVDICYQRGEQEARVRAGNSRKLVYTVQGWVQTSNKKVWKVNTLVSIYDKMFNIRDEFLISDIRFTFDDINGTITELSLVHKEAFKVIQKPIKKIKTETDNLLSTEAWREATKSTLGKEYIW